VTHFAVLLLAVHLREEPLQEGVHWGNATYHTHKESHIWLRILSNAQEND
jgi:hypothetical protein